jgi:hypothetical protein
MTKIDQLMELADNYAEIREGEEGAAAAARAALLQALQEFAVLGAAPVEWQFQSFFSDIGMWSTWQSCTPQQYEIAAKRPDKRVRKLYAAPVVADAAPLR